MLDLKRNDKKHKERKLGCILKLFREDLRTHPKTHPKTEKKRTRLFIILVTDQNNKDNQGLFAAT